MQGDQFAGQCCQIATDLHRGEILGGVQLLVDVSDCSNTSLRLFERHENTRVVGVAGLQAEKADNHLEIILHPMMDLPDQHALFFQGPPQLVVLFFARGDVLHHLSERRASRAFWGTRQHSARVETRFVLADVPSLILGASLDASLLEFFYMPSTFDVLRA